MTDYITVKTLLETELRQQERAYPLMGEAFHSLVLLHRKPTERVCLCFHGFTAGPYQFEPLGRRFFNAGYNVVVPLLPGHGRAGNWGKDNPPPLPEDPKEYLQFAVQWLNLAQRLGHRVIVCGLSGGGTLAAWLALERATAIERAILFAPYLSGSSKVIDLFVQHFDTFFSWTKTVAPSYAGFDIAALRAILDIGQHCLKRVRQSPVAPTFTISSESDKAVSNLDHKRFFEAALKQQPLTWYNRFDKVLDIPHTMMTEQEGNRYQNLLIVMTQAFVESKLTWIEVEEIAYYMTKGRTFRSVVADLGLEAKVSKDMPAMMTMVDKWAIVVSRELSSKGPRY
ncbi:MAG: alpha/beta fold hydrolase [Cyanobacteria bacterium Co-bin8]|nr:alpha/beta fold hydrolase [Cyanobacteria bacterium Co-bin8]